MKKYNLIDIDKDRFILFSDAVIAIAITILVIDLKVPEGSSISSSSKLFSLLIDMIPMIRGFLISFFVIANFWTIHLKIFSKVKSISTKLIWLNIQFLFFITLMSFTTNILVTYPCILSIGIYSLNNIVIFIYLKRMINHIISIHEFKEIASFANIKKNCNVAIFFFLLSILLSPINVSLALYSLLLMIPTYYLMYKNKK